ncbi:uncharacterized protein LOC126374272 [Pectinophora gossypiella]|uniref:uncharacterized protein LOC126374272 n=1 Tax=Pectinophora gossypiella TaxID=13191 RepID=UPI00214F145C|nr:uncharacterized protein LOC126374272 [Pectinophora gossypiella]
MNKLAVNFTKNPLFYLRFLYSAQRIAPILRPSSYYTTTVDAMDAFTIELLQRHRIKVKSSFDINSLSIRYFMDTENPPKDVTKMTVEELDAIVLVLVSKNKDKKLTEFILECTEAHKNISDITLKKVFRHYSVAGKPDIVEILQKYCVKVDPCVYKRNGEFMHYLAKSQCMKGNSDKGLSILTSCYKKNEGLRSFYRVIFRELIQDSVLNRSEASLVIFKKYVTMFSEEMGDHYPLVCFWHLCWSSSWFSDQMLANELLETSTTLQDIVKDKATAFSISILRQEYNEDAVVRLLQSLLKYDMLTEYAKVLQVLFGYKLRKRDVRGCTEIIRNCEVLGIALPSDQQGRYIKMLIDGKQSDKTTTVKPSSKNFKLKF